MIEFHQNKPISDSISPLSINSPPTTGEPCLRTDIPLQYPLETQQLSGYGGSLHSWENPILLFNPPISTQHTNFYALLSNSWCNWKSWIPVSGHKNLLIHSLQSNAYFDHIEILSILFSFHSSLFHQFP